MFVLNRKVGERIVVPHGELVPVEFKALQQLLSSHTGVRANET